MSQKRTPDPDSSQLSDPRDIARWTRVYAQNRSLGVAVFMVVFVFLCGAIGGSSYLAAKAYLQGNMVLLAVCIGVLALAIAADIYCAVPGWGGKRMVEIATRLYAKEGDVAMASPPCAGRRRLALLAGSAFGLCIVASVILGMLGYIPTKYMQPVSALYVVPFLVTLGLLMRPATGPVVFLWPALYALHAILIVAGAPILFTGKWEGLNMLIPIAGYGMLASLVGHACSRFALHRLKHLAQMELPGDKGQEKVRQP